MQLSIMDKVYSTANKVVSWLGKEADQSDKAIALLQSIAQTVEIDQYTFVMRAVAADTDLWSDRSKAIPWKGDEYACVCALLSRPYFERVWIQQEVHLAKVIEFHCGKMQFSERKFWWSVICLNMKLIDLRDLAPITLSS